MQTDEYRTVAHEATGIYKEKGSRFLAFAYNVTSADEAKALVKEKQKQFHDARHHCYAWRLGAGDGETKVGDDGEPSGTAGRPILGQILSAELTNIVVIVVRYFGGIKLGTGGLIVAYKTATADALQNADIVLRTFNARLSVSFPYLAMNGVMKTLKDSTANVEAQNFDTDCQMTLSVRIGEKDRLVERLNDVDGVAVEELQ
ncbi:MAG: YigZ family protein [Bacteroidales bacterium]|nr:YigZ family protein [Bacteroidales bacterium]